MKFIKKIFNKKKPIDKEITNLHVKSDFSNFNLVTDYIYKTCGISDLEKRMLATKMLQQLAEESNITNTNEFLKNIQNDKKFYQQVLNIVTVNETYFMREIKELKWLISYIKNEKRGLNILSLPSSSGEEVYSIIIMLKEANIDMRNIRITGHDINTDAIDRAKTGIYKEHSLHKMDKNIINKYFTKKKNTYIIDNSLKQYAQFSQKNIFDIDTKIEHYDIILSRNMFIYFDSKKRERATNIIVNLLNINGIFIKGHADNISTHKNLKYLEFGVYKQIS